PASTLCLDLAKNSLRLAAGMPRDLHAGCVRYLLDAPAFGCYSDHHEQSRERKVARRARPLRSLRRALRAGDVDTPVAGVGGRICARAEGPGISARVRVLLEGILRSAHAALFRRADNARTGRGEDLSQTRGPAPHRRAQ